MILTRYLTREVASTLFAVTLVLLLIFLSNQLVRYLSYAASGKIAANILLQLMGFSVPLLLALLLPLGLYLGIVLAYGRLYADNEMRMMQIGGFSTQKLIKVTSVFALFISFIVLILMLWINPLIIAKRELLLSKSGSMEAIFDTLLPGRFQVSLNGERVVYVGQIARNHQSAKNLFIAEQRKNVGEEKISWTVLSAAQASQLTDPVTQEKFMVASDGYRYDGTPGENEYKIIQFKKYAVHAQEVPIHSKYQVEEMIPTHVLWQHYQQNPLQAAELQWRLSIALSAFLLALLAIPLSQVRPRQGRYASLFPAILIYVVYVNLLFVARHWIEQKTVPIDLGMWWVHLLLLAVVLCLFLFNHRGWMRHS